MRWFRVQDVPYHGHRIAVTWDADGRHYGMRGLSIEVDGRMVARRATAGPLTVPLPRTAPPTIARPVDLAMQLVRGEFPKPSASNVADPEALHDAIDGRVWFFPELPNGWSSQPGPARQWFAVDLGEPKRIERAELAFFADAKRFAAPAAYRLQTMTAGGWRDLPAQADAPLPNGVTHARFDAVRTDKVRVLIDQRPSFATRLVELKLF